MKKLLLITILTSILLLTGCVNKTLKTVYDDMQPNKIDSYQATIEVIGNKVTKTYEITNYMNQQYTIKYKDVDQRNHRIDVDLLIDKDVVYELDNTKANTYIKSTTKNDYYNPNLYLKTLLNTNHVSEVKKQKDLNIYTFKINKSYINSLLKSLKIDEQDTHDADGKVYLTSTNHVSILLIQAEKLTIKISFSNYNQITEILH